jgi:hypothetical protein
MEEKYNLPLEFQESKKNLDKAFQFAIEHEFTPKLKPEDFLDLEKIENSIFKGSEKYELLPIRFFQINQKILLFDI